MKRPAQRMGCPKCHTPLTIIYQPNGEYDQVCPECVNHLTPREQIIMKYDRSSNHRRG